MLEMDHGDRHEAQSSKYRSTGVSKEIYIHTEYKGSTSTIHSERPRDTPLNLGGTTPSSTTQNRTPLTHLDSDASSPLLPNLFLDKLQVVHHSRHSSSVLWIAAAALRAGWTFIGSEV